MSLRAVVALVYSALAERADELAFHEDKPGSARKELDRALQGPTSVSVQRRPQQAAVAAELEGLKAMGRNVGVSVG